MEHSLVATSLVRYWRDLEATWSLTIPTGAGPPRQAVALRGRDLLQPQGTAHKGSEGWRRWLRPQPPAGCGSRGPCGRVGAGRLGSHAIQLSNPHILVHGAGRQRTRTGARRVRRQLRGKRGSTSKAPAARSAPRWRRGDRSRSSVRLLRARFRPNHSVASPPGCAARGVPAPRGPGSRRRRRQRRRARATGPGRGGSLPGQGGPGHGRRRHVRVLRGAGGLVGGVESRGGAPVAGRDVRCEPLIGRSGRRAAHAKGRKIA